MFRVGHDLASLNTLSCMREKFGIHKRIAVRKYETLYTTQKFGDGKN